MGDTRRKDKDWIVTDDNTGARIGNWAQVQVALLMDLRDELKKLNALLHCHNFVEIPSILRKLERNTKKKRKKRAKVVKLRAAG
jgi:hypothetical protein